MKDIHPSTILLLLFLGGWDGQGGFYGVLWVLIFLHEGGGGGWLRDSLRQFCFNAVQFRFELVVPKPFFEV